MHKKQQDRKKRKNFTPELFERYFRRNEGTTDYATIPSVTLTGDAAYQVDFLTSHTASQQMIISGNGGLSYIAIGANGELIARLGGQFNNTAAQAVQDGKFNRLLVENKAGRTTVTLNDTQLLDSPNNGDTDIFTDVYRFFNGTQSFQGILSNLKIWDNGTLIRDYPLDDNSDDLRERVSGQNGTGVNFTPDQWGLFQQQVTGEWLGQELVINGGFDSGDLSQWVTASSTLTVVNNQLSIETSSSFNAARVEIAIPASIYRFSAKGVSQTLPTLKYSVFNLSTSHEYVPTTEYGVSTFALDANVTEAGNVGFYALRDSGNIATYVIDNVSVKEVLNVA